MAGGAADRVVFRGPAHGRQELGDDETVRRLLDVLAVGPPAEVVGPLDLRVGALEPRHVLPQELRRLGVRDYLRVQLLVGGVEPLDVRVNRGRLQDRLRGGRGGSHNAMASSSGTTRTRDAKGRPRHLARRAAAASAATGTGTNHQRNPAALVMPSPPMSMFVQADWAFCPSAAGEAGPLDRAICCPRSLSPRD